MKRIFISHIALDADLALEIKKSIKTSFGQRCDAFASSAFIMPGAQWLKILKDALSESTLLLVLCSKKSIYSPWIFFEAGCGWNIDLPILPICYGGQLGGELPVPLVLFQSLQISDASFSQKLVSSISTNLGIGFKASVDYQRMTHALQNASKIVELKADILDAILGRHSSQCSAKELAYDLNIMQGPMRKHLASLVDGGYVKRVWNPIVKECYPLTPKGSRLVLQSKIKKAPTPPRKKGA